MTDPPTTRRGTILARSARREQSAGTESSGERGKDGQTAGGTESTGRQRPLVAAPLDVHDEVTDVHADSQLMGIPTEEWAPGSNHPRGPASAWAAIAGVAIVVLVIIALLAALFGLQQRNKLRDRQRESQQIQTVAGQTVAALTTYDYQNLDAWKKAVLAHATGAFQNSFNNAVEGAKLLLAAAHNRSTGAVQNVFVGPVSGGKDTAGVVVDVTVTGLSGTRLIRYFQQVTLLKVGGQWRVDDMQVSELIAPSTGSSAVPPTGTAPSGGAAPATTVPPATHP